MPQFTIPRTGQPAITFYGDHLATVSGRNLPNCQRRSRWHEIAAYKTDSGRWGIHVAFKCTTRHDQPNDAVAIFDKPRDAVFYLWHCDPTAAVHGWPGERYTKQDMALRNQLENQFEQLVTQLLGSVPTLAIAVT